MESEGIMLLDSLLTVHVFSVIVWIGFGLYELLLSREIRKARGTSTEIDLIRINGRYGGIVAVATLLVAISGILMASLFGGGGNKPGSRSNRASCWRFSWIWPGSRRHFGAPTGKSGPFPMSRAPNWNNAGLRLPGSIPMWS
jgi:hypothetical protein